jgi:hypothetical protein
MLVALAALTTTWAMWGARPAKAIVILNSKTGLHTLTRGNGMRILGVNVGGTVAIIDDGKVVASDGTTVMVIPMHRLEPGQGAYLADFVPQLTEGRLPVRVEVRFESDSKKEPTIQLTAEVYDTATGKTDYSIFGFNPQPEPPIF